MKPICWQVRNSMNVLNSEAFKRGGVYILRSNKIYAMVCAMPIGVGGIGPHKHNDWLSYDLCLNGTSVVVDPGSYCYTANLNEKNRFRSTAAHNTLMVDGEEQISLKNSIFAFSNPSGTVVVDKWESGTGQDLLAAHHTGYQRLSSPVIHQREFVLDKGREEWRVVDIVKSHGRHHLDFFLHLDLGLEAVCVGENRVSISNGGGGIGHIYFGDNCLNLSIEKGWVSRAYNQRNVAAVIRWKGFVDIQGMIKFESRIVPV